MNKHALIIFVRNPELGKVKTRLAGSIGDEKALVIYQKLLQLTHDMAIACDADRFLYYSGNIQSNDIWENRYFFKREQSGPDLGTRMYNAFREVLSRGYKRVLIVGSDCPGLIPAIIQTAFAQLLQTDVVIGPASDGGYYLLGMKELLPLLFEPREWGSSTVLQTTVSHIAELGKSYSLLPVLSDIDQASDLEAYKHLFGLL